MNRIGRYLIAITMILSTHASYSQKASGLDDFPEGKMPQQIGRRGDRDALIPQPDHVDHSAFGALPLELYIQTKGQRYPEPGKMFPVRQWDTPSGKCATAESLHFYDLGFAAREMAMYLDSLQQPNGLFYHGADAPFFWRRGDGWVAAGMSELLSSLLTKNQYKGKIMQGYKKMMVVLLKSQEDNGMWRQLIDGDSSWEESSGTGMFTFAIMTGVKKGWLDKKLYAPAARKGWLALVSHLNENAELTDICEGTNKKNDRQFYPDRKRLSGDLPGQAPVLWYAATLLDNE